MTSERIDHEARALESDKLTKDQWATFAFETSDASNLYMAIDELKHATLALVEQQRIANLIAFNDSSDTAVKPFFVRTPDPKVPGKVDWKLDPDIAAALHIKEEA